MKLRITVHGVAYEVDVEVLDAGEGFAGAALPRASAASLESKATPPGGGNGGASSRPSVARPADAPVGGAAGGSSRVVTSPIAGTVVEVRCRSGDNVTEGQILMVFEAMKMNTSIAAPASGRIRAVPVAAGDNVREGQTLVEYE